MASGAYDLFRSRAESHQNQMKKTFQRHMNLMTEAKGFFFFLFDLYFVQLIILIRNVKKISYPQTLIFPLFSIFWK